MAKKQIDTFFPARVDPRLVATNPFDALLPPEKLRQLSQMPPDEKHMFYGRVVESVFSSPAYTNLVFETADREFDRVAQPTAARTAAPDGAPNADLTRIVEEVVSRVLKNRG